MSLEKEFDFYKNRIGQELKVEDCVSAHLMIPKDILEKIYTIADLYELSLTEALVKVIYSTKLCILPVQILPRDEQLSKEDEEFNNIFVAHMALVDSDYVEDLIEAEE